MILSLRLIFIFIACALSVSRTTAYAEGKVRRNFEVEWEAIEGASLYEVKLARKDEPDKKPTIIKTKDNHWSATIKPGNYAMQIRTFDDRGVPGDWSPATELQVKLPSVVQLDPTSGLVINSSDDNNEEVKFKWEAVPGAEEYQVNVRTTSGSGWQKEKQLSGTSWEVKVPVGEALSWNVTAVDGKGEIGDVNALPVQFEVKGPALAKPQIKKPLNKYVRELQWAESPKAKGYSYEITYQNPRTRKWDMVESKAQYSANKLAWDISRPSGRYKLKVQAFAERRAPSKKIQLEFETRGGFKDLPSLEMGMLRDSIVRPTSYYAIGSYLLTSIKYQSVSYDENQASNFSAVGGTGRIGLGYQEAESQWGGFGIVDLSGFEVGGQRFTFASAEAHLTHKLEFGQGGLLLVGTGLFAKELPVVRGNKDDGFTGLGKVKALGPHLGFTYWVPLSERYGVQFNGRIYESLFGSGYNGAKTNFSTSYQYGLLGSYRVAPSWMGYAGYAFRKDAASYGTVTGGASFAKDGQINSVDIEGHYVNLLLEFSF